MAKGKDDNRDGKATGKTGTRAGAARDAGSTVEQVKDKARAYTDAAGDKARAYTRAAQGKATAAARSVEDTFDANPLAIVGGALAVGALAAALFPASEAELKSVGPTAVRLRESLGKAFEAARRAGLAELTAGGL